MLAILFFTTLIARRTTGVSENLRRFAAVGLGNALCPGRPIRLYGLRIEGSIAVFLSPIVASPAAASTPASLCQRPFTVVRTPMLHLSLSVSAAKRKRHSPWAMPPDKNLNPLQIAVLQEGPPTRRAATSWRVYRSRRV